LRPLHALTHALPAARTITWISSTQRREFRGGRARPTQADSGAGDGASESWELVEEEEESNTDLDGVASVSSESDTPPVGRLHSRSPSPLHRSSSSSSSAAADDDDHEPPKPVADSDIEGFTQQQVEQVLQRRWVPQTSPPPHT
jgi:hypothetical protein